MNQLYLGNSVCACLLSVLFVCMCVYICTVYVYLCSFWVFKCLNVFSKNFVPSLKRQLATSRWFGRCMAWRCLTERPLDLRLSLVRMMSMASGNWMEKSSVHLPYVSLKKHLCRYSLPRGLIHFHFDKSQTWISFRLLSIEKFLLHTFHIFNLSGLRYEVWECYISR